MSKNTGTSELINYFDLGVNGDVGIAGSLDINTIANATTDTDTFLVSDTGIIKYRTGAQLLSDIGAAPAVAGGYVPYTGATTNVDLGVYNLTTSAIIANGSGSNSGIVHLESNAIHSLVNGYGSIASGTTNQFNLYQTTGAGVFRGAILSLNSITEFATRTFTLPDADGTIALTSNIPANAVGGTGTTNTLSKFTASTTIGNSSITDDGTIVSILNSSFTDVLRVGSTTRFLYFYPDSGSVNIMTGAGFTGSGITFAGFSNYLDFNTNSLTRMRLTTAGNLVLGPNPFTDSGARLQVSGTATFSSSVTAASALLDSTSTQLILKNVNGGTNAERIGMFMTDGDIFKILSLNDNNTTRVDNIITTNILTGNVGIGTSSPAYKLVLESASTTYASSPSVAFYDTVVTADARNWMIGNIATDYGSFNIASSTTQGGVPQTPRFTINRNGNVGIGTASPLGSAAERTIHLSDGGGGYATVYVTNSANTVRSIYGMQSTQNLGIVGTQTNTPFAIYTNDTERMRITSSGSVGIGTATSFPDGDSLLIQNSGVWNVTLGLNNTGSGGRKWNIFSTNTSFSQGAGRLLFYNATDGTNAMLITSNNNVLIGTTTDNGSKLQVAGNLISATLLVRNESNSQTIVGIGNRSWWTGGASDNDAAIGTYSPNMCFFTNNSGTERMRITSDNNVLFNTTSTGTTNSSSFIFRSGTGAYSGVMIMNHATTNNTGAGFIDCYYNTSYIGGIVQNGASNISFLTSSDYRLKEDLKDFDGLSLILSLKVYDFKWKTEDSRMYGVLAHELQEVVPYTVSGDKDEIKENGKIKVQAIDYSKLVPLLIKAIQEQQVQIQELKNKLS